MSIEVLPGDCLEVMASLPEASVDAIVTDPPYELGFMGRGWDKKGIAFDPATWAAALRVLKPGGHMVAFGAPKNVHRLTCAIEDAGFEIRDCLMWVFGTGFPKSHDVSKGIDKAMGAEREVIGRRTDGPSSWMLMQKIDHRAAGGTGMGFADGSGKEYDITAPATEDAARWQGWGTALKPACENIILARKPSLSNPEWVTIATNIDLLEARLWSMLPATVAAEHFGLSQAEHAEACGSAQWNVEQRSNTPDALSEAMGTSQFAWATISSLSTVLSWRNTLGVLWQQPSMSIIATELNTTIDWSTLRSCLSRTTLADIIRDHSPAAKSNAPVSAAARHFRAMLAQCAAILEQHAVASVIEPLARRFPDADARSPAYEPIILARKPLIGTVAENVLRYGTGALNIDACRVEGIKDIPASPRRAAQNATYGDLSKDPGTGSGWDKNVGRWPANLCHDGSEEVLAAFPETSPGRKNTKPPKAYQANVKNKVYYPKMGGGYHPGFDDDSGSAARFFYSAKASSAERAGSKHPTVKPIALMRWLCRLITPPGGTVLDPFAGTGTTGEAADREGFGAILIEREAEYLADIHRRIANLHGALFAHAEKDTGAD